MATIKQHSQSTTVQFNTIAAAAFSALGAYGYEIKPELVALIMAVGNWLIRAYRTKGPLEEK